MTRARTIASGVDYITGIDAGEVLPHIIPGVLYPAVAGNDLDGTDIDTSHGSTYTYGTTHTDGRMYYYTDIKGSKPIKDPRIGAHFGGQRHMFSSLQLLEQETATHGDDVHSADGREWIRRVGSDWIHVTAGDNGNWYYASNTATEDSNFWEITGYFNAVNWLTLSDTSNDVNISIDGTANSSTFAGGTATVSSPIASTRFVNSQSVVALTFDSTPALGIHTVKLSNENGDYMRTFGIELIAQDTSNVNNIQIPSQNVVSYGKKFTVSDTPHYDPFNGFTNETDNHNTYIDYATSLGTDGWKNGSNYYRPYNGGRVVKWVDSSGTIKTSVTIMPPNARSIANSATLTNATAKANASIANNTFYPTMEAGAIDNSLSEVAKTFHWREFGNGSANANASFKDFSTVDANSSFNTSAPNAYVMDDGLTSLICNDTTANNSVGYDLYPEDADDYFYLTFIGTGMSYYDENDEVHDSFVQNLPYGTHVFKFRRDATLEDSPFHIDGIQIKTEWTRFKEFTFFQPKMPPIPEDAVVLADYMLMADYVQNTSATIGTISKGVRRIGGSREHFYNCAAAMVAFGVGASTYPWYWYGIGSHASNAMTVSIPYFGTSFTSFGEDQSQTHTFTLDGSAVTPTEADSDETRADLFYHTVSTLGLHTKAHTLPAGGWRFAGTDVATPIHTSSHYQSFETPYLKDLVGGDRNMEQTNLVVTLNGKTWDEVTRDTSYMGNKCVKLSHNDGYDWYTSWIFTECRGQTASQKYPYHYKDWVLAYDKLICLVDGDYVIHQQSYGDTAGGRMGLRLNGEDVWPIVAYSNSFSTSIANFTHHFTRGEFINVQGESASGIHQSYLQFTISRV